MIRKMMALSLVGLVLFIACKKSGSPTPKPVTTDSTAVIPDSVTIIGKWSLLRSATYYYNPSGAFMDSFRTKVGPRDYYDFEKGVVYFHEDDSSSAHPFTDTITYKIIDPKKMIWRVKDTVSYKLTKNTTDTMLLTAIRYNTTDGGTGKPANEYDTLLIIK